MDPSTTQPTVWTLARDQHGVVTRRQLLDRGFGPSAIAHRLQSGRLHPVTRGVYAVGRPDLTREGVWMATALRCGSKAGLSHPSGGALWRIVPDRGGPIHVSVPAPADPREPGVVVHRRVGLSPDDFTTHRGIPVTSPRCTLVDLASMLNSTRLEAAVNEADALGLVDPEALRAYLDSIPPRPGVGVLRTRLDRRTFTLTRSALERLFLPIARSAGLPTPLTGEDVNGFEVDFFWPDLGLVVETDGLRYHRTPAKQARDRLRDQAHTAAGQTPLRFTHEQVAYEPAHVERILGATAARLAGA